MSECLRAGATGARLLVAAGDELFGTTRLREKMGIPKAIGDGRRGVRDTSARRHATDGSAGQLPALDEAELCEALVGMLHTQ